MSTTTRNSITDADIEAGRARGAESARSEPRAQRAEYDATTNRLAITLRGGAYVAIPVDVIDEISGATQQQLGTIKASRFGDAVELRELDVDISVVGLLRDLAGPLGGIAAAELGRRGGSATSDAKSAASRANGLKGGRPRLSDSPPPVGKTRTKHAT